MIRIEQLQATTAPITGIWIWLLASFLPHLSHAASGEISDGSLKLSKDCESERLVIARVMNLYSGTF